MLLEQLCSCNFMNGVILALLKQSFGAYHSRLLAVSHISSLNITITSHLKVNQLYYTQHNF